MSDNNQPDKQIEKEKENKDGEVSKESEETEENEENEENENEEEEVEREVIDFTKPSRTKEYFLRPRNEKLKPSRKLYGDEWGYPDSLFTEPSTQPYDPVDQSDFELGNVIETFDFKKLIKVKPYKGRKRIYEESEGEDYTDLVEDGDSEYNLENVILDVDGDNENTIIQKEKDWLDEWHNNYIWDEDKKEFNSNGKRLKNDFVDFCQEQIQKAEPRKNKEHNLKKKHLLAMFVHFDGDRFDIDEDYKNN
jgi:hypothetical protein